MARRKKSQTTKPDDAPAAADPLPGETDHFRDRIVRFERVDPSLIDAHPLNWRLHPEYQAASLANSMARIGLYDAVLLIVHPDNPARYMLVDGELRWKTLREKSQPVPALITDLSESEAGEALLVHDRITSLAGTDNTRLTELILHYRNEVDLESIGWPAYEIETILDPAFVPAAAESQQTDSGGGQPVEFQAYGDDIKTNCKCPSCGYEWSDGTGTEKK